jgi:hypothetical protein
MMKDAVGCPSVADTGVEAEAEARAAALCHAGYADAVYSEDGDALLLYGVSALIRDVRGKGECSRPV